MRLIESSSAVDAWIQASQVLLKEGTNLGDINEILNLAIEITPKEVPGDFDENFDKKFREIFGDDRIDYVVIFC